MKINLELDTNAYKKIQEITCYDYSGGISTDKIIDLIYDLIEQYEVLEEKINDLKKEEIYDDRVDRYYEEEKLGLL